MADLSKRLREPLVLTILIVAVAGWLAFFAMWINSAGQTGRLSEEIATLTSERNTLRSDLTAREQTAGSIEDAQTELANLQSQRDEANSTFATASADLEARQAELDTVTTDLDARRTEADTINQELADATTQTEGLAARQAALQSEIQNSEKLLLDVGTRLEDARRQEETSTTNLAQITQEAAAATSSLAESQSALQTSRSDLATAQQQLADNATQSEQSGTQLTELQAQVTELETRRTTLETDVTNYQNQLATLQPQVEQLTTTLAQRSSELQAIESQMTQNVPSPAPVGISYNVSGEGAANGIALTLNDDETFEMRDRYNRSVSGNYTLSQDELVLSDATGRLGNATFPMTCPIEQDETGITIGDSESCLITGLRFDRMEPEAAE